MVVAVPMSLKKHCGQTMAISYKGKTVHAKVVDLCASCHYGYSDVHVDVSPGVFSKLADLDTGIVHGVSYHIVQDPSVKGTLH